MENSFIKYLISFDGFTVFMETYKFNFTENYNFNVLAVKYKFTVLMEKSSFVVLAVKYKFTVFCWKHTNSWF